MKFYTSDLHFDHSNMLKYEHRPWKDVEEMNKGLLFRINARVRAEDELYILGDFTLRTSKEAVEGFRNGIICNHVHLITGNHDYFAKRAWASELFETIQPYKEIHDEGYKLVLCHFPILYWNGMDDEKPSIHLYGHMHSREEMQHPHKDAYNVGVDVNGWAPITLKEILKRRNKDETTQ